MRTAERGPLGPTQSQSCLLHRPAIRRVACLSLSCVASAGLGLGESESDYVNVSACGVAAAGRELGPALQASSTTSKFPIPTTSQAAKWQVPTSRGQ